MLYLILCQNRLMNQRLVFLELEWTFSLLLSDYLESDEWHQRLRLTVHTGLFVCLRLRYLISIFYEHAKFDGS